MTTPTERRRRVHHDVSVALVSAVVSMVLVLLTAAFLRYGEGSVVTGPRLAIAAGVAVAQSLLLVWRSASPVRCLVAVAALQVLAAVLVPGPVEVRGVAALVAAFTVGLLVPLPRAVGAVVVVGLVETAGASLLGSGDEGGPALARALEYGATSIVNPLLLVFVGAFVGTRRAYAQMLTARAEERVSQERARADRAVLDERSRMARELHDIAAHHLSGMVVQAVAVERLIDTDPAEARTVTRALRLQGRQTLASLRTAVGILRERTDPGADAGAGLDDGGGPVPGVAAVAGLVASVPPGEDVRTEVVGRAWELPPVADVTVFRVVQEALSNARQHAPGAPVVVRFGWGGDALGVDVENQPPPGPRGAQPGPARQGLGLVGMRERADLVGADLRTGPTPSGGWSVRLCLPRDDGSRSPSEQQT